MSATNPNTDLARHLNEVAKKYRLTGEPYKARAFGNAARAISKHLRPITSGAQAQTEIAGIKSGIGTEIDIYLSGEESERLRPEDQRPEASPEDHTDEIEALTHLQSYYGIGPTAARKFYQQGLRTAEDLLEHATLTQSQRLGIRWHEHIQQRIPRGELNLIRDRIAYLLEDYDIKWIIAGSYRRKEETSGDIDLLVESQEDLDMEGLLTLLRPILVAKLASGPTKFMGMVRLGKDYWAHRIDIRLVPPKAFPFALMYFTGSQQFNILMRQRALDLGLTLNEYGLTRIQLDSDSTPREIEYQVEDEADIFEILGLEYVPPELRLREVTGLKLV